MKMNKDKIRINGKIILVMFLLALFLLPAFSYAGLVGSNIPIASYAYNQQNPDMVYLPDQNLWFVVWEDWRNHNGTKADIWGQFIDQNGQLCGSEFQLTNVSTGNQTMPRVDYRYGDKIVVVWQDTRANYVYYATITSFPTVSPVSPLPAPPANCSYSPPAPTLGTQIGFNGTSKWNVTIVPHTNGPVTSALTYGDGTSTTYSGNILSPVVPGNIHQITVTAGAQTLTDNTGTGILSGPSGNGSVNYTTGFVTVNFNLPVASSTPIQVTFEYYTYDYNFNEVPVGDTLSSRTSPRIAYDPVRDSFWVAWTESRSTLNRFSEKCFNLAPVQWTFGDTKFPGYVALDGPTLTPLTNDIGVNGADIIRNDVTRTNRRIASTHAALIETYEYEFFTQINNITLDSDTTSPETFLAWEGVRKEALLTCTCTDANGNGVCDPGEVITSTLQVSNYDDGNVHIYSIFDGDISQTVVYSMKLDSGLAPPLAVAAAHNPALGFDPITGRFLAAWEDMRGNIGDPSYFNNGDPTNTKVYGQIVQSGSGPYNSDFIISFSDFQTSGKQDANVAKSKQTSPYISYDAVNQRYFVVWQDGRNGSTSLENLDIYGQKVDAEGSREGTNYAIVTQPSDQYRPAIAYNDVTNQFLAVWKDARNADQNRCNTSGGVGTGFKPCGSDVYGQIFTLGNPALTLLNPDNTPLSPPLLNQFQNPVGGGVVQVGLSAAQSFKMRNTGDTTLTIHGIYQTEPPTSCPAASTWDITPFSFDGLPQQLVDVCDSSDIQLVPGAELPLTVRFTPVAGGSFNNFFKINSDGGNLQVNLSALSTEADIAIASPVVPYNFGSVYIGNFKDQTFVVKNIGVANLIISTVGPPSSPFSIQSDACSGQTVAPGATCSIVVRYTPTAVTPSSSSFTINSNAVNFSALSVNISGTGLGAPSINVSPVTIGFGNVQVGQTSPVQTVTITNNGTLPLTVGPISGPAAPFTMTQNCFTAPATTGTLSVNASCQMTVQVTPTIAGTIGGTITIQSNDPVKGGGVAVSLSATGVTTPQISANPLFVNFPSTPQGSTVTLPVTVTSAGSANLQITGITNPSPDFSITGSTCIGSFIPGATCTITVSFSPTKTGIQNSSFAISSNDPVTPSLTISLSGTGSSSGGGGGLPPSIQASPMLVDFGNVRPGSISAPRTVTVTNTGLGNLVIGTIQYPGKPYTVTSDTCKGQTIAPSKSCTLTVIFNPTRAVYYYPYYIIVSSNDPVTPALKITLRGLGTY